MKRFVVGIIAAAVLVSTARTALAQSKTINAEMKTATAVIEAIEASTRTVTLKKPDGTFVSIIAGPEIKRFDELKLGDKVTAKYYENVVVRLKKPGEADANTGADGHDRFGTGPAGWHQSQAADHHGRGHRHRPGHALDHLHRAERLEVFVHSAGQGGSRHREGRRQGRHHLDGGGAGVGRARRHVEFTAGAIRRDRPGPTRSIQRRVRRVP